MAKRTTPTIPSIITYALSDGDKLDSFELHGHVTLYKGPKFNKAYTDRQIFRMVEDGRLLKSKNDMTDENVCSTQSKFLYFLP